MTEASGRYVLFHAEVSANSTMVYDDVPTDYHQGCGSVFPLVVLRALKVPHEVVTCDFKETTQKKGPNYDRLLKANPLAQFPTLITPEGYPLTEMTAIVLCKFPPSPQLPP